MKVFTIFFILFSVVVLFGTTGAPAQTSVTTKGKEFYLVCMANQGSNSANTFFEIYIASDSATTGIVEAPGIGFSKAFSVAANSVATVSFPDTAIELILSEAVEKKAIHVTTEKEVSVYAMYNKSFSADAYLAYPVESLGKEYYALCHGSSYPPGRPALGTAGQFAILATEDSTNVTIEPRAATLLGKTLPFTILLPQKGDVYQVQGNPQDTSNDLTGSHIVSDKPVAVFSGHQRAAILTNSKKHFPYNSRDHLIEQLPAVSSWGKRIPFSLPVLCVDNLLHDTLWYEVRIVAAYDSTIVTIGDSTALLNKGQFYKWITNQSGIIEANHPVLAGLYAPSTNLSIQASDGDPFLATLPPSDQFLDDYVFTSVQSLLFTRNYITLTVSNDSAFDITLDGTPIPQSSFTQIGNSSFDGATFFVDQGSHHIHGTSPFGILVYAYGIAISYGYIGGTGLRNLLPPDPSLSLCARPQGFDQKKPGDQAEIDVVIDNIKNVHVGDTLSVTVEYDPNLLRNLGLPQIQFAHLINYTQDVERGKLWFTLVLDSVSNSSFTVASIPVQALLSWYSESTISVTSNLKQRNKKTPDQICSAPLVINEDCVKAQDLRKREQITMEGIYPNPSHDNAAVILRSTADVAARMEIVDVFGRTADKKEITISKGQHAFPILMGGLSPGLYFLCISAYGKMETKSFTVER